MIPLQAPLTTTRAIARWARETPDAIAVAEDQSVVSYRQLAAHTIGAIRRLAEAGAAHGSIVAIECPARYINLVLILACEAIGAAHASLWKGELTEDDELVRRCDVLCLATAGIAPRPGQTLLRPDEAFVAALAAEGDPAAELHRLEGEYPPETIARIARTSGTTGPIKNVAMTRRMVESIQAADAHVLGQRALRHNFVSTYGLEVLTTYREASHVLRHGAAFVLAVRRTWQLDLAEFRPCQTYLTVGDAARIAEDARQRGSPPRACLLRLIGGAVPPSLLATLTAHVATDVFSQYSMTESIMVAVMDDNDIGTVLPDVEARLVDDAGLNVEAGEPGLLLVRSPRTCDGYLWDPALSGQRFADGWFRSSDIAVMPEPGKLKVIGRADDAINIGGLKIVPGHLESQMRTIDGVTEAALLRVDNEAGVGEAHVVIERRDARDDQRIRNLVTPIIRRTLDTAFVHFTDAMPRAGLGKIDRAALQAIVKQSRPS